MSVEPENLKDDYLIDVNHFIDYYEFRIDNYTDDYL
jgi:hypothetical protein